MDKEKTMIALDCGNSSFRIVAGWYRDGKIHSEVVSQMPNNMVRIWRILLLGSSSYIQ